LLKVESYRKGIVLSSIFNLFYKGLVFINSLLIAFYFGTQLKMDIYFYAYNTIVIVATFIASANSSVIIPESMRIRIQQGQKEANSFLNLFIYGYMLLTLLICLVFLVNPVRLFTAISKYDAELLSPQLQILYMAIPLLFMMPVVTLLTDILASYRYFTVPVVAGIINSVFAISFLLIFHNILDIRSVLLGLLISYSVNMILLIILMVKYLNWKFTFSPKALPRRVINNILYSQSGNFVTSLGSYAPLYFLSGTVAGIIASLNYAQQIVTQANSFITYQVSVVNRIRLSELYAEKKYKKVNEIFQSTIRFLLFILIPISGLLFLYSEEIITLLFRRGSFTERSVKLSSDLLRYLALSLPFIAVVSIAGNLYVAAQLIRISIVYQIISNILLILLIAVLVRWLGYNGYPIAYLAINILNVLVVYIYCTLFFPFIKYIEVLKYLALLILFNGAVILLLTLLNNYKDQIGSVQTMLLGGVIYLIILLAINFKFRLNNDFNVLLVKVGQQLKLIKPS
jgi:peptidoglycan biosynthesis protein MviN/MurJ (putative lipid II flippase)